MASSAPQAMASCQAILDQLPAKSQREVLAFLCSHYGYAPAGAAGKKRNVINHSSSLGCTGTVDLDAHDAAWAAAAGGGKRRAAQEEDDDGDDDFDTFGDIDTGMGNF